MWLWSRCKKTLIPFSDPMDGKYSKNIYACAGEAINFYSVYRRTPCTFCKFILYQQQTHYFRPAVRLRIWSQNFTEIKDYGVLTAFWKHRCCIEPYTMYQHTLFHPNAALKNSFHFLSSASCLNTRSENCKCQFITKTESILKPVKEVAFKTPLFKFTSDRKSMICLLRRKFSHFQVHTNAFLKRSMLSNQ